MACGGGFHIKAVGTRVRNVESVSPGDPMDLSVIEEDEQPYLFQIAEACWLSDCALVMT